MTEEARTDGPDPQPEPGIEEELRKLAGRFANVLQAVWASDEKRRVETEVRDGLRRFSEEVEQLYERTRESTAGERVRSKFEEARGRATESDAARRTLATVVQGLHRLSEELGRLADRFTPAEKGTGETGTSEAKSPDDPTW